MKPESDGYYRQSTKKLQTDISAFYIAKQIQPIAYCPQNKWY